MTFKEQAAADIDVFLNLDEFAGEHDLVDARKNARRVRCIVDTEQAKQDRLRDVGGTYSGDVVLYLAEADATGLLLQPDSTVILDKRNYVITSAVPSEGVLELTLMQIRSGGSYGV